MKARTLANLEGLLLELERNVQAAGGTVHWADSPEQVADVVASVADRHGARNVLKVKSMTTDELGLNAQLAKRGIDALETDLAELIVQLAGDRQSHILVPAIHRNRQQIREIFAATIARGRRLSAEPAELAAVAREHLRDLFLTVPVAVSGANFAVAETGSVGVVESEGNGRMCLTLPDALVTVMGIEKVLEDFDDVVALLDLLPRASTGERMNPYTTIWTGVTADDGPREFHLVLLDAGRTRVLGDPHGRQALHCIRCSACLNVCPVYSRVGGAAYGSIYPGPIGAILSPQLVADDRHDDLPFASTLCGACYQACPVKIDIPELLVHLRSKASGAARSRGEAAAMRAAALAFGSQVAYERAQRLARAQRGPLVGLAEHLPPLSRWARTRDLPQPPRQTFREWWNARREGEGSV